MRAVVHSEFGDPAEVLASVDAPKPEAGEGQVLVRTILASIHNHDLLTVRGVYGYRPELPAIGGTEAVGTIDALGPGVEGLAVGQRVAVAGVNGTWAEFFSAPATSVIPLPDAITDEQGAQIVAMPFSALTLLEAIGAKPGEWIIQNAANGAVGKAVAMTGAARGINVISLVRREAAIGEMGELGIGNVVATASDGWQARVRELTGDAPIVAGVDSVGGQASADMLALLGDECLLVCFGSMTGADLVLPAGDLIYKQATVRGFWGVKAAAALGPEGMAGLVGELMGLVVEGKVRLPVDGIYPFAEVSEAVKASLTPGKAGKVLLRP